MKVELKLHDDKDLREYIKELIREQVKAVGREEIKQILTEVMANKLTNRVETNEFIDNTIKDFVRKELIGNSSYSSWIRNTAQNEIMKTVRNTFKDL